MELNMFSNILLVTISLNTKYFVCAPLVLIVCVLKYSNTWAVSLNAKNILYFVEFKYLWFSLYKKKKKSL